MRFPMFNVAVPEISLVLTTMVCLSATTGDDNAVNSYRRKVISAMLTYTDQVLTPDRGYIAARRDLTVDELMSMDTADLGRYRECLRKEVECSFVFGALVHVYLTGVYLSQPEMEQVSNLKFTEEAAYMVNYAWDEQNSSLAEVMWILYLYALRTDEFIESGPLETILAARGAVEKVLEEFTESYQCKVYDRDTGLAQGVAYTDKIKQVMEGRTTGMPLTIAYNKWRLSSQRKSNRISTEGTKRFGLEQLRLYQLMVMNRTTVDELINTFSVQVDSNPIVERLLKSQQDTYRGDLTLHGYIDSFATLHSEFITVLKAVVMRIAIVYFNYIRKNLVPDSCVQRVSFLYRMCDDDKIKMAAFLADFADYIDQPDDIHLKRLISLFGQCSCRLYLTAVIDHHISIVLGSLKNMTSGIGDFATLSNPLAEQDYGQTWIADVEGIAKKYNIIYSEDIKNSVQQVTRVVDVYISYTKKITENVDFGVINSLIRLKESGRFKRLARLETGKN